MTNLRDEFGNAEIENMADDFEAMRKALADDFQIGDRVILSDPTPAQIALFGLGVHTVENFVNGKIQVRLWHGKRSIFLERGEIVGVVEERLAHYCA